MVSPYLIPWVLCLLLASPELTQGVKAMSVLDSMLEPPNLQEFILALETLHKFWTTFLHFRLCPYAPGLTSVVAQALLVSGLTSTLVP